MDILKYIVTVTAGYLLGSISFSVILTRGFFRKDVREQGSGNAGATNVARVFGMKAGAFTLVGDVLKTLAAIWIGKLLLGDNGLAAGGIACVLGHCFPVFFQFRGGKGVSVGAAVGLMIDWRVLAIILATFLIFVLLTRIVSVGSMAAAAMMPVSCLILGIGGARLCLGIVTGLLVLFMHRGNFRRLCRGEEAKFHAKR